MVLIFPLGELTKATGLFALQADPVDWIYVGIVHGGPWVLIGLGMALRALSPQAFRSAARSGTHISF